MYIFWLLPPTTTATRAEGCLAKVLTQAAKIQGPHRWCLPSSRGPWQCPSEARFRRPLPSPQTRRDGWAFRSPGDSQGRWSHVVRCWSPDSGCNMWAQRWSPSHSLWPKLVRGGTYHHNQLTVYWKGAKRWWICWHLCILLSLYGLANMWQITGLYIYIFFKL